MAVWVVKDYVRDGAIVPFAQQWRRLCEHVGFVTLHEHHALLVEDHGTQESLFGGEAKVVRTEKKSFFRRLAEKKGSPAINHETVYCMVKPLQPVQHEGFDLCLSSPPYVHSVHDGNGIDPSKLTGNLPGPHTQTHQEGYGCSAGQLGRMPEGQITAVLASPPYAGAGEVLGHHNGIDYSKTVGTGQRLTPGRQMYPYGSTAGQLGSMPAGEPPPEEPAHA